MAVTISKGITSAIQPITLTAGRTVTVSNVVDVSAMIYASLYIDMAYIEDDNFPVEPHFIVQVSQKASGNDTWVDYQRWVPYNTAVGPAGSAIDVALNVGDDFIDDLFYNQMDDLERITFLKDATLSLSEWATVTGFDTPTTTYFLQDGVVNAHTTSTLCYSSGFRYRIPLDLMAITRMRVICDRNVHEEHGPAPTWPDVVWGAALIHADELDGAFLAGGHIFYQNINYPSMVGKRLMV